MLGSVRTKEKCPACGGEFEEVRHPNRRQKIIDLECARCLTNPKRYFVDARDERDAFSNKEDGTDAAPRAVVDE